MSLTLYYHPLASFCHKVLIALYEAELPFDGRIIDLANLDSKAELLEKWPVGKFPVLHDDERRRTVPETSIIIEYLSQHFPSAASLVPEDHDTALDVRLWDRFFDCYVSVPMQRVVAERLRPEGAKDPFGLDDAKATLTMAYDVLERHLDGRTWAAGASFTLADCSAAPALFYADIVHPFRDTHPRTVAYFERLLERPSFARVLDEARPYFVSFPYLEAMPARFR